MNPKTLFATILIILWGLALAWEVVYANNTIYNAVASHPVALHVQPGWNLMNWNKIFLYENILITGTVSVEHAVFCFGKSNRCEIHPFRRLG